MKKILGFSLLAIVAFSIFIAVLAPASAIWRYLEPAILPNVPDLQVTGVQGNLWSGQAELFYREFPSSQLKWEISALALLGKMFDPSVSPILSLAGEGHNIDAEVVASQHHLSVSALEGYIDALYINRVSQPQGLTFVERIQIESLTLTSDLRWIQDVDGKISWPGGKIVSRTLAAGTRVFDLPALEGEIGMQGEHILLTVRPKQSNEVLVDIVIKTDGWVVVAVKAKLFDIAGLPWPAGTSPQDTVLQFEEKLLQGIQ